MLYRAKTGMEYLGKRLEPGEEADDIPETSIPWLLEQGHIEDASQPLAPPAIASVTDLDGNPIEPGPDGMIPGEPLDLTDEQRAALPELAPQDADPPLAYAVGETAGTVEGEQISGTTADGDELPPAIAESAPDLEGGDQ